MKYVIEGKQLTEKYLNNIGIQFWIQFEKKTELLTPS
jgi:hypothetical protein